MASDERDRPDVPAASPRDHDAVAALDPAYLAVILAAERRPENAPAADKSWVARMDDAWRRHYDRPRRS